MSDAIQDRFGRLISTLKLQDIRPIDMHSSRRGEIPSPGSELQLVWNQGIVDGDPLFPDEGTAVFRPRYELLVKSAEVDVFQQVSLFVIAFKISDRVLFDSLWADTEIRKMFVQRQLQRTLWPLFRQHVHDGMSRLGMQPVTLPWLF